MQSAAHFCQPRHHRYADDFDPGHRLYHGIRDFVQGDYLSGTIRMIDALLIAASIAIGTGLVLRLYTVFTGVVVV